MLLTQSATAHHSFDAANDDGPAEYEIVVVDTPAHCREITAKLRDAPVLALDCEGVRLGRDGTLCLLQATVSASGPVFLFDVFRGGRSLFDDGGLRELLANPQSVKLLHDCCNDNAATTKQFNAPIRNVFDTQMAAMILQHGTPMVKQGLKDTLTTFLGDWNLQHLTNLKERVSVEMRNDAHLWSHRPLPRYLQEYAAADVGLLLPLYAKLQSSLTPEELEKVHRVSSENLDFVHLNRSISLNTLRRGMVLEGRVTSTMYFGWFVTVGLCVDGLIHRNELLSKQIRILNSVEVENRPRVRVRILRVGAPTSSNGKQRLQFSLLAVL